jgi:NADH:ubiquinone oxidoreductase subunit E
MTSVPGLGLVKGMALTLRRFFQPAVTIKYPEVDPDIAVKYRGRLQLLYDEHGTLKCETCFQCAQACPIECIDMGGRDTKGRYAIHWGAAETYGERREESALRRAGREVPDGPYTRFEPVDLGTVDAILDDHDHDPHRMLSILEAVQAHFGHLPVAALKRISHRTGAWYAMIYGTASYYRHLRFERTVEEVAVCRCTACLMAGGGQLADALAAGLGTELGRPTADGRIRFAWLSTHVPDADAPLVAVDGEPQPEVSTANATAWAQALVGEHPATRTVH